MSKTLLAPIAIVIALALAACGGSAPEDSTTATDPAAAPATDTMAPAEPAAPAAEPAAPAADPAAPATTTP